MLYTILSILFNIPEKPSAPCGPLQVNDITEESVVLSWDKPVFDGGSPITNYIMEKYDSRRLKWIRVDLIPSSETSFKV